MLGDPYTNEMSLHETREYSPSSVRRLRQKLSYFFSNSHNGKPANPHQIPTNNNVIETDYLRSLSDEQEQNLRHKGIYTSQNDMLYLTDYSFPFSPTEDYVDEEQWNSVSTLLRKHLRSETAKLRLDLFVPSNLLERISKDIVRMSCCEPSGLRGCSLFVNLQRRSTCQLTKLGRVEYDLDTISTFELHLTLIEDKKRWHSFKDLIAPVLPGCLNESQALEVFISPGYTLVKNKLYRPN